MTTFDAYVLRHGESWALFIIEEVERVEGVRYRGMVSLEDRWNYLMQIDCTQQRIAA